MIDLPARAPRPRIFVIAAIAAALALQPAFAHGNNASAPAAPAAPAEVSAAVATVNAFHAALASGDTAAALALMTEDALIFESGGVERGRAEYAGHHLKADAAFSAATRRTLVSRSEGQSGDAAWVTSVETVTGTFRSRTINSRSVETMLLRRVEGRWLIAHIHWSSADLDPAT